LWAYAEDAGYRNRGQLHYSARILFQELKHTVHPGPAGRVASPLAQTSATPPVE
jgi:hypothetical protein